MFSFIPPAFEELKAIWDAWSCFNMRSSVPAKNKLNQPPPGDLCYRPLQASDMDEMIALHQEWFPVSYDQDFYNKSVTGNLHSIVAVLPPNGGSHVAPALPSGQTAEENILGIWILDSACFFLQCKVLV